MLFTNFARKSVLASVAAIALMGTGCAAQQGNTPQATASADRVDGLKPGTVLNVGQGTYTAPALPPTAYVTTYALTGEEAPRPWPQSDGFNVGGVNGTMYIPPTK